MNCNEINVWLETLLAEIDEIKVTRKSERRVRVDVEASALPALLELLKGKASYVHLSAIACVDWPDVEEFELVYHCWSYEAQSLLSAHTRIPRNSGEALAHYISVYDIYQPAAFFERDIYEMYGIYFESSPYMEKFILTEWNGPPPMRKDFDAEAYVNDTFNWAQYNPQWLQDLEDEGGGIAIRPEDVRL